MQLLRTVRQVTVSKTRETISDIINKVKYNNDIFAITRREQPEVLIIKYPENYNKDLDDTTNFNANSSSFDFLKDEPDIYSVSDLVKKYV